MFRRCSIRCSTVTAVFCTTLIASGVACERYDVMASYAAVLKFDSLPGLEKKIIISIGKLLRRFRKHLLLCHPQQCLYDTFIIWRQWSSLSTLTVLIEIHILIGKIHQSPAAVRNDTRGILQSVYQRRNEGM